MSDKKRVGAGFGVMMLRGGKVLLGKRHDDPEKASSDLSGEGTWTMPGGKMDFGEEIIEGAKREVKEETGLDLGVVEIIAINNDMTEDAHYVTIGMFCEDFEGEPKVMEPDEITSWDWFDIDSLPSPMYPSSRKLINNYLLKKLYIPDN